jgi:hypothetical protein
MKKWWKSKGVWIGVCTILIGFVEIVRQLIQSNDFSVIALLTAFAGFLKVIERFTSSGESVTL